MKVLLLITLGIIAIIVIFLIWFLGFYLKVPKLKLDSQLEREDRIQLIDHWFEALQRERKFNGAVLMTKDGKALLCKAYGYADHKLEVPLNEHSSFQLASVSKQFTAAGIMLLKERGKLAYDELVSKYISNFPYPNVSIRHLLNQTSGIPDVYMKLAYKHKKTIPVLSNQIAIDLLIKENKTARSEPNSKFEYSNTNYVILARIIELVTGLTFEDYMQKEIFEPMGMLNTRVWSLQSVDTSFKNKTEDLEMGRNKAIELKPSFVDGVAGDGAVYSSVADMVIWDGFWHANPLISPENLQEAFLTPVLKNGKTAEYGFGWMITPFGMWHNGSWLGARTFIVRNTKLKTCMVILDNSSNVFFDKIIAALSESDR